LIQAGYDNVSALVGGWEAWLAAGYPTEAAEAAGEVVGMISA